MDNGHSMRAFFKSPIYFGQFGRSAFFNIVEKPLLVQKQMIAQKKALLLSFLELEIKVRGKIRRLPGLLSVKSIFGNGI